MRTKFILFQLFFFAILLTSCAVASEPTNQFQYTEEKTELPTPVGSKEFGDLLDSYAISNGDIYSLYCQGQDGVNSYTVTKQSANHISEDVVPLQFNEAVNYRFICADSTGTILLADTTTLYLYRNESGASCQEFPAWAAGGMIIAEDDAVICQTFSDSPYYIFDLSTGAGKGTFLETEFLFEQGKCQPFLDGFPGQEMLITSAGLYTHDEASWNLRVPATRTSMAKAGFIAKGIERNTTETYIVYDSDYQYTYSPKEANEDNTAEPTTLRVTVWQDRDTLRTALAEYQIANPDVTIEYTFRCKKLPKTEQEANSLLQITNAEIVSPQAADLYVLDYLPWENYQKHGLLADLTDIVTPYAENERYFENILTTYKTENGLYAVPWFFSTKYVLCRQELAPYVQDIHALADYLENHPGDPGLIPYCYRDKPELFLAMMYDFYGDNLYENGRVTLQSVENFLTSAKIIYDRQQENSNATMVPGYAQDMYSYSYLQQYPCGAEIPLLFENQEGSFLLITSTPMGISDLLKVYHHPDYSIVPIDGIHTKFLFGIHSASKEREAAEDLLKYLLSYFEKAGRTDPSIDMFAFLPGFPIYKPILSGQLEKYVTGELEETNPPYTYNADDTEKLLNLIEGFHKPGYSADAVTNDAYSIFAERSQGYLTGDKPLDITAKEVYNGLMLLYNENQ